MDETDPSLANAETPAVEGKPPLAEKTTTTTTPTPADVVKSGSIEEIRALMRQPENNDALVRSKVDNWTGLTEDEPPAGGEPAETGATDPNAEAKPGEEKVTETANLSAEEQEQAAKAKAAEEEKQREQQQREGRQIRFKRDRFSPEMQPIIDLMAEDRSLTFEAAQAKLIEEGKIPARTATAVSKTAKTEALPEVSDQAIADQEAAIAKLETDIEEAGARFDTRELGRLNIAHNKALAELGKLQTAATQRSQAQARAAESLQTDIAAAEMSAVEMFPDAGKPGSQLYEAIEDLMDEEDAAGRNFRADPDYPVTLAAKAAKRIGYKPAAAAAALPLVPKRPSRAVPVNPASGGENGNPGPAKPLSLEQRAAAAVESNDPEKIRAALREAGTHSLDEDAA